jgi:hypothetical protein
MANRIINIGTILEGVGREVKGNPGFPAHRRGRRKVIVILAADGNERLWFRYKCGRTVKRLYFYGRHLSNLTAAGIVADCRNSDRSCERR